MHELAEAVAERRQRERPGAVCKVVLRTAGVTEKQIAEALGVSPGTVSRWVLGARRPRGEVGARFFELICDLERAISS